MASVSKATGWMAARPGGPSGGGITSGLALLVPDCGRAIQAAGLAPGGEPLVLTGDMTREDLINYPQNRGSISSDGDAMNI